VKGDIHGLLTAMLNLFSAVLPFNDQGINEKRLVKLMILTLLVTNLVKALHYPPSSHSKAIKATSYTTHS